MKITLSDKPTLDEIGLRSWRYQKGTREVIVQDTLDDREGRYIVSLFDLGLLVETAPASSREHAASLSTHALKTGKFLQPVSN